MIMPSLFVLTRWQSKFKMIETLLHNKDIVRSMCDSMDEDCRALQGEDLKDEEWKVLEVPPIN
jgi:hypothetical protein